MDKFAQACWKNWYRDYRIAIRKGDTSEFASGRPMCWERFWQRRLRALEDYYRY